MSDSDFRDTCNMLRDVLLIVFCNVMRKVVTTWKNRSSAGTLYKGNASRLCNEAGIKENSCGYLLL